MLEIWNELRASVGDRNLVLVALVAGIVHVANWCRIYQRAGHSFALGFLMALPGAGLVVQTFFAWGPWPIAREARELASVRKAVHRADAHVLRKVA